ncbi:MAG: hypothetical protein KAG56_05615 [Sulfurovaceae bacterium]|nr:hypothetical protein [Sulfurovaceae bacterium]
MILRLLIFAIVAGFIYRFLGGKIPLLDKKEKTKNKKSKDEHDFGRIETTSECAKCGTYMTEEDAIIYQKKAYCSDECLKAIKR